VKPLECKAHSKRAKLVPAERYIEYTFFILN